MLRTAGDQFLVSYSLNTVLQANGFLFLNFAVQKEFDSSWALTEYYSVVLSADNRHTLDCAVSILTKMTAGH